MRRYGQITGIAVKHGFGPVLGLGGRAGQDGAEAGRLPPAGRLRRALEECGGMFVKLGQILSTRSDLLPAGVIAELSKLRDRVPPADPAAVRALIESELGAPAEEVFAEFEWEPLAAASIGQAHRARLHDGQPVIVKVLRPGIGDAVERDLLVLDELARTAEARTAWAAEYRVTELTAEFGALLREELDLRREAGNATAVAGNLAELPEIHIPEVHPDLSTSRLLVMEWLDGVSVGDAEGLDELGVDRRKLADLLLRCSTCCCAASGSRCCSTGVPRRPAPGQRHGAARRPPRADRLRRVEPAGPTPRCSSSSATSACSAAPC